MRWYWLLKGNANVFIRILMAFVIRLTFFLLCNLIVVFTFVVALFVFVALGFIAIHVVVLCRAGPFVDLDPASQSLTSLTLSSTLGVCFCPPANVVFALPPPPEDTTIVMVYDTTGNLFCLIFFFFFVAAVVCCWKSGF